MFRTPADREQFDKNFDFVLSALLNARSTAQEIADLWNGHASKVRSGEVAKVNGPTIRVTESIEKQLRKDTEGFLNAAVRALKQGMQSLAEELGVDIGFLFKKESAFQTGNVALRAVDPALAHYLQQVRSWSEPLLLARNAIEHEGWTSTRDVFRKRRCRRG